MRIKTSELTGSALNWAVAKCRAIQVQTWFREIPDYEKCGTSALAQIRKGVGYSCDWHWERGVQLIESEGISIKRQLHTPKGCEWRAWQHPKFGSGDASGPTFLIAAMRCYITNFLGDEIEIPEELL